MGPKKKLLNWCKWESLPTSSFPFKNPTGNCMQQTIFWFMSKSIIAFKKSTFKECCAWRSCASSYCRKLTSLLLLLLLFDYHRWDAFNHFSWLYLYTSFWTFSEKIHPQKKSWNLSVKIYKFWHFLILLLYSDHHFRTQLERLLKWLCFHLTAFLDVTEPKNNNPPCYQLSVLGLPEKFKNNY